MEPANPDFASAVQALFERAPFIRDLGLVLRGCGPGWAESELVLAPRHLQQDGWVHAGVLATVADHTAGAAGMTLVGAKETVVSAEFKINLLHAASGERLACRARVLKPGTRLIVVESEVLCPGREPEPLVAKATVTLVAIQRRW